VGTRVKTEGDEEEEEEGLPEPPSCSLLAKQIIKPHFPENIHLWHAYKARTTISTYIN
jgi:hypothetical protein